MQDEIIKKTGDSRYLKSVSDFLKRYSTYESMAAALVAGTLPVDFNGKNKAGIAQEGTPLTTKNLLSDETAEIIRKFGGKKPETVNEAFQCYYNSIEISDQNHCLTFSSDQDFSIILSDVEGEVQYSYNMWQWETVVAGIETKSKNGKIYLRGRASQIGTHSARRAGIRLTGEKIRCTGKLTTLFNWQDPDKAIINMPYGFYNNTALMEAPDIDFKDLVGSYQGAYMFSGCTGLTKVPKITMTMTNTYSYQFMFENCTALKSLPKLTVKSLVDQCYGRMFYGCTSIKLSTSKGGEYQYVYSIPYDGGGEDPSNRALVYMFSGTGGPFAGTPTVNTVYYTTEPPV